MNARCWFDCTNDIKDDEVGLASLGDCEAAGGGRDTRILMLLYKWNHFEGIGSIDGNSLRNFLIISTL
jgi:hypothetical protein